MTSEVTQADVSVTYESDKLPCDVLVQPHTLIKAGCSVNTLMECIEMRRKHYEKGLPLPPILAPSGEGRSGAGEDALVKALRPFALAAKWWKAFDSQHRITTLHQHGDCLEVGDLRAAESALAALNARQSGEGELEDELARVVHANGPVVVDWMGECLAWRPLDYGTWSPLAALNARQPGEGEREALREALAEAYRKGATDVHSYWVNNPGEPPRGDPEFGESASDYAAAALDIFDSAAALRATDDAGGAK